MCKFKGLPGSLVSVAQRSPDSGRPPLCEAVLHNPLLICAIIVMLMRNLYTAVLLAIVYTSMVTTVFNQTGCPTVFSPFSVCKCMQSVDGCSYGMATAATRCFAFLFATRQVTLTDERISLRTIKPFRLTFCILGSQCY